MIQIWVDFSGLGVTNDWTLYPAGDHNKPTLSTAPSLPQPSWCPGIKIKILITPDPSVSSTTSFILLKDKYAMDKAFNSALLNFIADYLIVFSYNCL